MGERCVFLYQDLETGETSDHVGTFVKWLTVSCGSGSWRVGIVSVEGIGMLEVPANRIYFLRGGADEREEGKGAAEGGVRGPVAEG